ncbi:uncharacterized protein VTP21DRAFT_7155 [Calcarisporiella thermophila]|uniref:uncharacterized protein n=1 Tax=Calcarisporiella thermophila TaxID=911321 RepID=UPI003742F333
MRSLSLLSQISSAINNGQAIDSQAHISIDTDTSDVYFAFADYDGAVHVVKLSQQTLAEICTLPLQDENDGIVGLKYLPELQACCIALINGDIILIHKEPPTHGESVEVMGAVENGILAMEWSPDEELVVLITGNGNLLEMTKEFDTITEFPIHTNETGEAVSVSVGWGRKETQFHGSEGKQAALRKIDQSAFMASEDDDRRPRVSWRGDGAFFACSVLDETKNRRVIRVYNREGSLQNTSEPVDRLEHALFWRPSGNLIASSQRLPHRHDICFFERNGLRHGEFTLREAADHKVVDLAWNCDSTVLAVWLERIVDGSPTSCVQLWTMNNYHWYLKQELCSDSSGAIVGLLWDPEDALSLHIITQNGEYTRFNYCWDTFVSTSLGSRNSGHVAVIDGSSLLLTPFRYLNVPPPMSAFTVDLGSNAAHVAFGTTNDGDDIAVLTADHNILFFERTANIAPPAHPPKLLGKISLENISLAALPRQIAWVGRESIIFLQWNKEKNQDFIVLVHLAWENGPSVKYFKRYALPSPAIRIYHSAAYNDTLVEMSDCTLAQVSISADDLEITPCASSNEFPEVCQWIGTTRIGPNPSTQKMVVIGLNNRNRLYANEKLLSSECNSFFIHNDYLIFTTSSHRVRFIPFASSEDEFKLVDSLSLPFDEMSRRVERGSRIVLAVPAAVNLVLQMPRGNLETISPRALVLSLVRRALEELKYHDAFVLCRKHRIDMNIICDYNLDAFMDNIDLFVTQIPEVEHLNLFLSSLRNEDVTTTLYPFRVAQAPTETKKTESADKINRICDAVRSILQTKDVKKYIQSILTAFVRKTPPDLESALEVLAELKVENPSLAEDALKYAIFLVDADSLYDVALGMYDFSLVLMVAQQSQKDPREYLAFLKELQSLEQYYRRYRIDDYLKRYTKALTNLSLAGEEHFDELIRYMQQHNLYLAALKLYSGKSEKRKRILIAYGESQMRESKYEEAAISFELAGELTSALSSYKQSGAWREVFSLAKRLQLTSENINEIGREIVAHLYDKRQYRDAATVLLDYLEDPEEAVSMLLKAYQWQESIRISLRCNREDLIETHVKPGLVEGFAQMSEDIQDMKEQFEKQTSRLQEIRKKKAEEPELPPDDSLDNVDILSDTTSMVSQFTRYTAVTTTTQLSSASGKSGKSSKSRRREERKKLRGKKGSIYEEEYLVDSLRRLMGRTDAMKSDVGSLCKALIVFDQQDKASVLQTMLEELLERMKTSVPEVFKPFKLMPVEIPINATSPALPPQVYEPVEQPRWTETKWKHSLAN